MALPLAWPTAWTSWAGFGPGTRTSRGVVCTMWARPPTPATACLSSSSPPGWSVKESWRTWDHLQMRCNHQVLFFSLIALPTPAFDRGVKAPPWGSKRGREGIAAAQETRDLGAERDRIDHHHWHRLASWGSPICPSLKNLKRIFGAFHSFFWVFDKFHGKAYSL